MRSEGEWSCPPLRGEEAWRVKRKKGRERKGDTNIHHHSPSTTKESSEKLEGKEEET